MEALRDLILDVLADLDEAEDIGQDELLQAVRNRSEPRRRTPTQSEVSGRLAILLKEGIVQREVRGRYRLTRLQGPRTDLERQVGRRLKDALRPAQLGRLVLWEATPYLDWSEDGAPGPRLVVEQPQASQLRDLVATSWPGAQRPALWRVSGRGPIGSELWTDPEESVLPGQAGVVLVEADRIGGTGLVSDGYRIPFRERILCDFLGLGGPDPDVGVPIVQNILLRPDGPEAPVSFKRLWQSATALKTEVDLSALLARLYERLDPETRKAFKGASSPTVAAFLEGRA